MSNLCCTYRKDSVEEFNMDNRYGTVPLEAVDGPDNLGDEPPKVRRLDVNAFATKKTIAQGMLDLALLTANASQLKYVLQVGETHDFYYLMVTMISLSIILQISIGIGFLIIGSQNINNADEHKKANLTNNIITGGIFLVTVLNVLISAFGMKDSDDVSHLLSLETNGKVVQES